MTSSVITIIEAGTVPEHLRERHGTYPSMFEHMLRTAHAGATFQTVSPVSGDALPNAEHVGPILITGSAHGVYDPLPWIKDLEEFVRIVHRRGVPLVGICFGHQLIAQALGGTVEKSEKGWGIGRHVYDVVPGNGWIDAPQLAIACSHQDQVIAPPAGATAFLHSEFTPYAGLLYNNGTSLSVQPHPEFDAAYSPTRCEARAGSAPASVIETARASLKQPLDNAILIDAIGRFLHQPRREPS